MQRVMLDPNGGADRYTVDRVEVVGLELLVEHLRGR
jgi:hypothetical protein